MEVFEWVTETRGRRYVQTHSADWRELRSKRCTVRIRFIYLFTCMDVLSALCLFTMCMQCPQRLEESIRSPVTRVTDRRLGAGNLGEQPVALTAEPSLQPDSICFRFINYIL